MLSSAPLENAIACQSTLGHVRRLKPKPKAPVTIIVGIICKDGIVLASDSQTTRGGLKRTDAEKIAVVKFAKKQVLVAQAGNAGNSARAIEILSDLAKDVEITDYRTPADLARKALIQVKKELRAQYCDCSVEEVQDLIWKEELQTELMLAYYFENEPYIFKLDLAVGRADKENSWYSAIGCGANLGSYLLTDYTQPQMNSMLASYIASYVVETVCKHDAYCSPPARVGVILNDIVAWGKERGTLPPVIHPTAFDTSFVIVYEANRITSWADAINKIMLSERQQRNKKLERFLAKQTASNSKKLDAFLANPTPKAMKELKRQFEGISHFGFFKTKPDQE